MRAILSSNVATAITKLVAVDMLPAIVGELVVGNLVMRDFEPVLTQPRDSVEALGSTIEMRQLVESTFQIPDVTKVLAVPDLLQLYMRPAVVALAEKIDTDLLSLASLFPSVDGGALTESALNDVDTALFNGKVQVGQPKYLIVDPASYSKLRTLSVFSEYATAGDAGMRALIDGSVGKWKDLYVLRSRCATRNLAFSRDAIGFAVRRLHQPLPGTGAIGEYAEFGNFGIRVVCDYHGSTLAQQFTTSILYGCRVLNKEHGVQVL